MCGTLWNCLFFYGVDIKGGIGIAESKVSLLQGGGRECSVQRPGLLNLRYQSIHLLPRLFYGLDKGWGLLLFKRQCRPSVVPHSFQQPGMLSLASGSHVTKLPRDVAAAQILSQASSCVMTAEQI